MSNPSNKLLSDITAFRTYSKYLKHLSRRETLSETINRNMTMHLDRFPKLSKDIVKAYQRVHDLKVMPSMRALDDNTIINTLNGWKLVGDICVGDILYDSSGKETKVLEVYKFKDVDLYQVDFSDNTNLVACDEHKWIVSTQDDLGTKKQRVVDTMFLKQHLKQSGKNNISIKNPEPLMYTTKDLKIDPYILGHWLGDGYSAGYQFSTSTEDSSFFIDEYNKYGYTVKQSTSSNIWTFFVHGLAKDLRVYDLLKNKHIPEIYLRGDLNQRLSLIQGLMDSDGHITDAGRCMFYNTNPRIVAGFCELLSSLGIKYTTINKLKKKEPHLDGKTVSFFTSLPVARLPRKYNNIRKCESTRTQRRYVTDVSFFKKGNASCFLVDSSDNSFLAGSRMIVTHNCLQFSGDAILKNNVRLFNCSAVAIDNPRVFAEILYVLLSGAGVGFSVQSHHVNALPKVRTPKEETRFLINDSIMGWAQSVEMLVNAYFFGGVRPLFDYSLIRPKGSYMVTTGAKAPGPAPLKFMLELVESKLKLALDRKLTSLECHDIVCIISDAVLAGGIRRSSLISLFDKDDKQMLTCKHGEWWNNAPWRARANNSAVLLRSENDRESFDNIFQMCRDSNAGEPGIFFSNSKELLTNPCVTGDTEILTDDGYKSIETLIDQKVNVWNGFEFSEVEPKITGYNQEIMTVTFSDGRVLNCTPYHKFHIAINYNGDTRLVQAKDLTSGMKLIKHKFPIIEHGPVLEDAYTQGFVAAEGVELSRTFYVYSPKESCLKRIEGIKSQKWEEGSKRFRVTLEKNPVSKNFVPIQYNLRSKVEWLAGLFDGDGTELKEGGLQLVSTNRNFLTDLQTLLSTIGVQSKVLFANNAGMRLLPDHKGGLKDYFCQASYRICIGSTQMQQLKELGLKCERMSFDKRPQRDASQFVTVVDVVENGTAEKVYCFTEPKRSTGIFNGVLTGNCSEISLHSNQFCNLTTINQTGITNKRDFMNRIYAASLIGTLQASYTDFDYLNPRWKEITDTEALLGVSFTGIADNSGFITAELLSEGAKFAIEVNEKYASKIGINSAYRVTCLKPEGSASCVLSSSSGIHARHAEYYIRRIRMNADDALGVYLKSVMPDLVEADLFSSTGIVVSLPQESPKNSIIRSNESALDLFNRTMFYHDNWINPGHKSGLNKHNISVTISLRNEEWDILRDKMWENRHRYTGISLLPYNGGNYQQAPFEEIDQQKYDEMIKLVKDVDLSKVIEDTDNTERTEALACVGGLCEIT